MLQEDAPSGDVTSDCIVPKDLEGTAELIAKQDLYLSGREAFEEVFKSVQPSSKLIWYFENGDSIKKGTLLAHIKANYATLLRAERPALNIFGHLCGIATLTAQYVSQTKGTKTKILDTRKTNPGLRDLEKAAVRHGGGTNHRMNLSDSILLKDNHIKVAGSITEAVLRVKKSKPGMPIEVEVTNSKELDEALKLGVEKVLLDNMTTMEIADSVKKISGRAQIEASGNMTLERINEVAKTGVDFISVGRITHSAPWADVSLEIEELK